MKVVVSAAAAFDLIRLRDFLQGTNPSAAQRAASQLDAAIRSLSTFPRRGFALGASDVRELVVPFGRSAYVLRYALLSATDEILILRIWHGREERVE